MAPSFYFRNSFQVMDRKTDALLNNQPHNLLYTRLHCAQKGEMERGRKQTALEPLSDTPSADTLRAVSLPSDSVSFNRDAERSFSYKAGRCNFL